VLCAQTGLTILAKNLKRQFMELPNFNAVTGEYITKCGLKSVNVARGTSGVGVSNQSPSVFSQSVYNIG
jgi:hypothetical protein